MSKIDVSEFTSVDDVVAAARQKFTEVQAKLAEPKKSFKDRLKSVAVAPVALTKVVGEVTAAKVADAKDFHTAKKIDRQQMITEVRQAKTFLEGSK